MMYELYTVFFFVTLQRRPTHILVGQVFLLLCDWFHFQYLWDLLNTLNRSRQNNPAELGKFVIVLISVTCQDSLFLFNPQSCNYSYLLALWSWILVDQLPQQLFACVVNGGIHGQDIMNLMSNLFSLLLLIPFTHCFCFSVQSNTRPISIFFPFQQYKTCFFGP